LGIRPPTEHNAWIVGSVAVVLTKAGWPEEKMHMECLLTNAAGDRIPRRKGLPFMEAGQSRHRGTWPLLARFGALLLVVAFPGGALVVPAGAAVQHPSSGQISFYSDLGNMANKSSLVVRPSTLMLVEDGSVALIHLKWSGWGTSVAHATAVWSASNGISSQAAGKRTTSPARLTLSSPGLVLGHTVYRCYQIYPPHPHRDIADHACMQRQGAYAPVTAH